MAWEVEYTEEFKQWWDSLIEDEQDRIDRAVGLLERLGPHLDYPHSSRINGSRHAGMRELRTQVNGRPFRVLYVFDPRRVAILLIGGDKIGNDRWYEIFVPQADRLYDQHLIEIEKEGKSPYG